MKKSYLIVIISAIVLLFLLGVYWYVLTKKSSPEVLVKTAVETVNKNEEVSSLVFINPLDNKPNINPADQTNPFKNIKTNPFE